MFCILYVCVNGTIRWLKHVKTLKGNLKIPALSVNSAYWPTIWTHIVFSRRLNLSECYPNQSDARWIWNTCLALWVLWAQYSTCWWWCWYISTHLSDMAWHRLARDRAAVKLLNAESDGPILDITWMMNGLKRGLTKCNNTNKTRPVLLAQSLLCVCVRWPLKISQQIDTFTVPYFCTICVIFCQIEKYINHSNSHISNKNFFHNCFNYLCICSCSKLY